MKNLKISIVLIPIIILGACASTAQPGSVVPPTDPTQKIVGSNPAELASSGVCTPKFVELLPNATVPPYENTPAIERMASGDFNGDGFTDLLVARLVFQTSIYSPIDILLNDGKGHFRVGTEEVFPDGQPTVQHPSKILIADFNGDGLADAYIADMGMDKSPWPGNANTLLLSNGDGTMFDATGNVPNQPDETHNAAAGDIDRDGDLDIYVADLGGGGVGPYILENDGEGKFSKKPSALPHEVSDLSVNWNTAVQFVDINNDAYPDLVLGQGDSGKFSHVYLNDKNGSFEAPGIELPVSALGETELVLDINAVDFNKDGWKDLLMVLTTHEYTARYIQILINQKGQSFEDQTSQRISQTKSGSWFRFARLADFNKDGAMDFVLGVLGNKSRLYLNDGSGNFTQANLGFDLFDFAIGDFNGDGWPDLMNSGSAYQQYYEFHATFLNQGCP